MYFSLFSPYFLPLLLFKLFFSMNLLFYFGPSNRKRREESAKSPYGDVSRIIQTVVVGFCSRGLLGPQALPIRVHSAWSLLHRATRFIRPWQYMLPPLPKVLGRGVFSRLYPKTPQRKENNFNWQNHKQNTKLENVKFYCCVGTQWMYKINTHIFACSQYTECQHIMSLGYASYGITEKDKIFHKSCPFIFLIFKQLRITLTTTSTIRGSPVVQNMGFIVAYGCLSLLFWLYKACTREQNPVVNKVENKVIVNFNIF